MGKRGKPKGAAASSASRPAGSGSSTPAGGVARGEVDGTARPSSEEGAHTSRTAAPPVETATPSRRRQGPRSRRAGRSRRSRRKDKVVPLWRELPMLATVALALALVIKTFFVQAFYIPSGSMENTINVGDRVLVNKLSPWFGAKPERGQVVVFRDPGGWLDPKDPADDPPPVLKQIKQGLVFVGLFPSDDEQDLIKRVIGVGGDTVACCDASGRITVNGTPLDEPYLHEGDAPSKKRFSVTVPKGRLWVMGDHRSDSSDSRAHMDLPHQGTISEDDVVGRAMFVAWPLGRAHRLGVPGVFDGIGNKAPAGPILTSAPVVMGMVGAVPMVLLRRRVRSRRCAGGAGERRPPGGVRGTGRTSSGQCCTRPAGRCGRPSCGLHRYEEAPWGKS